MAHEPVSVVSADGYVPSFIVDGVFDRKTYANWYYHNKWKASDKNKAYMAEHRDARNAYTKQYREDNKGSLNERDRLRRPVQRAQRAERLRTPSGLASSLLGHARARAAGKGLPFDLTLEWVKAALGHGRCALSGLPFYTDIPGDASSGMRHARWPSIDRVSSSGGYTEENCMLVCSQANIGKNSWPLADFLELARATTAHQERTRLGKRLPVVVGIDPGLTGALVAVDTTGTIVDVLDMPLVDMGTKDHVDGYVLREFLDNNCPMLIVIENVASRPLQGIASAFRFGHVAGAVSAVALSTRSAVDLVVPTVWKRHHGLLKTEKDEARLLTLRKQGALVAGGKPELFKLKKHGGRADAYLLAEYGREQLC